jgi:hypothetical protein
MEKWVNNPTGIPLAIREESNCTLNLSDMDVWAWVSLITPLNAGREFQRRLWNLFKVPGDWESLLGDCVPKRGYFTSIGNVLLPMLLVEE